MLSKIESEQAKEENSEASLPKDYEKMVNKDHKYPMRLVPETLGLQLKKRTDALTLKFQENVDTVQSTKMFAKTIKTLKKVRRIDIYYECSFHGRLKGLEYLSEGLERLSCLQSFQMKFNQDITDEDMKYIGEGLQRLRRLQSIDLNFSRCYEFTDEGVKYICKSLKGHRSLHSIRMDFSK